MPRRASQPPEDPPKGDGDAPRPARPRKRRPKVADEQQGTGGRRRGAGPGPTSTPDQDAYARKREAMQQRARMQSRGGRDIGAIPPVVDPRRREAAAKDFRRFCETYLAAAFTIAWSRDHLRAIQIIQDSVLSGGLFAFAMPRGSGKTTIVEAAVVWSMVFGHRRFVALVGATETHAEQMLGNVQTELQVNELLSEDFPEVCYPIERLEGISQRANGQLCRGVRTYIEWGAKILVLPTIPGSAASGAIVRVAGITGQIRGMNYKRADGARARPDFVCVDDPQTDESAKSPSQCRERERILAGAILGLAGPQQKISGFMPCTVIRQGDMADVILDRGKHPEWHGERFRAVYSWPKRQDLWDEYARIRRESLANGGAGETATRFYRRNRKAMDAGADVAWAERHNADELSAIQHAWNLRIADERAFFAEHQNEPLPEHEDSADELTAEQIAARTSSVPRGVVPGDAAHLTMFVDVQGKLLYWLVASWRDDFSGSVVDYGTWPQQREQSLALREARRTLRDAIPGAGLEGAIAGGLERLFTEQLGREWQTEQGGSMRVGRCLVDANWGESTDVVYEACRRSIFAGLVVPSHGRFIGPASTPMSDYRRKPGDRVGLRWRIPGGGGRRATRHVIFDANWWKSFVHARLSTAIGDPGSVTLFGARPETHRALAEQLVAERRVPLEAFGRRVDTWQLKRPGLDNHLLDCLVGAAVAASMQGATLAGLASTEPAGQPRRRIRLSDLQRASR